MLQTLAEKVRQRRAQMLVHSYIYYRLNDSLVSDDAWQRWANELVELQKEIMTIGFYDEAFSDWDASTGYHLPQDDYVCYKADQLLRWREKTRSKHYD